MKEVLPIEKKGGDLENNTFWFKSRRITVARETKGYCKKGIKHTVKQNGNDENNGGGKKSAQLFYFPFPYRKSKCIPAAPSEMVITMQSEDNSLLSKGSRRKGK